MSSNATITVFDRVWTPATLQPKWGNDVEGTLYGDPKALHIIVFCTGSEYHASLYYADDLPLADSLMGSAAYALQTLEKETLRRHSYVAALVPKGD